MTKRPSDTSTSPLDTLQFTNLGAGNEVGRSCHIIQFKSKTIMLDAGVHPAYSGLAALPFYDDFDLGTVDILLISHFHLDHAASLPYVMQKTNFRGRVFMTHPTKAIYKWLLSDFVRVSSVGTDDQLYSESELLKSFERIEAVDYHSTTIVNGIKFTPYHAGHVLGAAMFFIEIAGVKILFTGDYSREEDRHLNVAEVPPEKPDILITESTYGTASHQPRLEKESRLTSLISQTVQRSGRVLMPVFALGRAQELLLILDEYWSAHPELHSVPIYYASSLAKKCMAVYQTYIHTMNPAIQTSFSSRNPFVFRHIASLRSLDRFDDIGPCVMLASPGMLQNGVSRTLLERWCTDEKNTLIIAGYSVEGTMAKQILMEPTEITTLNGQKLPRRIGVEEISFAAHVDFVQNRDFIDAVGARHVILVHGEQNNMGRLKSALLSKYASVKGTDAEVSIWNPKNCEPLELTFSSIKVAKIVGSLARQIQPPTKFLRNGNNQEDRLDAGLGQILSGVIVQKDFEYKILAPSDLLEEAGIGTTVVKQSHTLSYHSSPSLVHWHLRQMFGAIDIDPKTLDIRVMDIVNICIDTDRFRITVAWEGSAMSDCIADAVLAILLGVESAPQSVKMSSQSCSHHHANVSPEEKLERVSMFLESQFGESVSATDVGVDIKVDEHLAHVDFTTMEVSCTYKPLRDRVCSVLKRSCETVAPLAVERSPQLQTIKKEESEERIKEEPMIKMEQ